MNFDGYIIDILKKLKQKGYDAYVVGRSVAYEILEKPIEEYEIWTSAPLFSIPKYNKEKRWINKIVIEDFNKKVTINTKDSLIVFLEKYTFRFEQLAYHLYHGILDEYNALEEIENKRLSLNLKNKNISLFEAVYLCEYLDFSMGRDLESKINNVTLIHTKNCSTELTKLLLVNTPGKLMKKYPVLTKSLLKEISNEILEMLDYLKVDLVLRLTCLLSEQKDKGLELLIEWGFKKEVREEVILLLEWMNFSLTEENMDILLDSLPQTLISSWFALKRARCLLDFKKIKEIDKLDALEKKGMERLKRRNNKF